uniref:Glycosyltransferase n=1 Tax=Oryza glumipatula TaxID=40148 RepID=A0A0E0BHU8_9ORYZ
MGEGRRAHAILFLLPCSGHINPMLKLAELLHSRRVPVTFVNTEHNHERLRRRRRRRVPVRGGARQAA